MLAGEWEATGTGRMISLPGGGGRSRLTSDHVIGVGDLAGSYHSYGFGIAAKREILSLERVRALSCGPRGVQRVSSDWSVTIPGRTGIHPPDMGVINPAGAMWAVELEWATKSVAEYQRVIAANRGAGLG